MSTEPEFPRAARVFVSFVSLLRANGFAVAPEQTTAFLAAIELLGPRGLNDIRLSALATLAPPPERRTTFDRLFDLHFRGSEAIERVDDGEDDETVRLQDEGRGDEEPLLSDDANDSGLAATRTEALVERRFTQLSTTMRCAALRARLQGACRDGADTGACAPAAARLPTSVAPCATASAATARFFGSGI